MLSFTAPYFLTQTLLPQKMKHLFRLLIPLVFTLLAANVGYSQDYTITTTGGNLIITDVSGNGETLEITQNGANIRFINGNTARTYSINGGAATAFTTPADVALAGLTSITINAGGGNDVINVEEFTTNLPSLTINGGTGDDQVNIIGDITFAANANLDIDLQNDDATPGTDRVEFATDANIILSGTGTSVIRASRDVLFNAGSSLEGVNGNITIEANQQTTSTTGSFQGVFVNGATIRATGTGVVAVRGKGGTTSDGQYGVYVFASGVISGGTTGNSTIVEGQGGASTANRNTGVYVLGTNSQITSAGGNVSVTGIAGGSGSSSDNIGISVMSDGQIGAGGSGTVTVTGQGVTGVSGSENHGVFLTGRITSSGGNVTVNGTGGGSGASARNYGLHLTTAGSITAGGNGTVTITGQGGNSTGPNSGK